MKVFTLFFARPPPDAPDLLSLPSDRDSPPPRGASGCCLGAASSSSSSSCCCCCSSSSWSTGSASLSLSLSIASPLASFLVAPRSSSSDSSASAAPFLLDDAEALALLSAAVAEALAPSPIPPEAFLGVLSEIPPLLDLEGAVPCAALPLDAPRPIPPFFLGVLSEIPPLLAGAEDAALAPSPSPPEAPSVFGAAFPLGVGPVPTWLTASLLTSLHVTSLIRLSRRLFAQSAGSEKSASTWVYSADHRAPGSLSAQGWTL